MAFTLTENAREASLGIVQKPQLVLEIDGVDTIYGAGTIQKYVRIGDPDLYIGSDWVIGGLNEVTDQADLISLDGSTSTVSQQLLQDKGGTSSISAVQISLIDLDNQITELISPGVVVDDVLGRKATVYLGYTDTAYPQDFIVLFTGIIDEVVAGSSIVLNIAHPEAKKKAEIFQPVKTKLTANANFRSAVVQSIRYQTRRGVVGTVSIEYTNTGTAGSEVVSIVGNAISVAIQSGVSTAAQVRRAVLSNATAASMVLVAITEGAESTAQTTQAATNLNSDTTITVASTTGFLTPPADTSLKTYIRINDEIIRYTGLTATTFTGCTREAFVADDIRAAGAQHVIDDEVSSFYRLEGNAFDLALKIMMSESNNTYFATGVEISSVLEVEEVGTVDNAYYFQGINVKDKYGLVPGDYVTVTGDTYGANNITLKQISSVNVTEFGSYIVMESSVTLVSNLVSTATASFKSQYNVYPEGLGLGGDQVDVPEFDRISETFTSSIFDYDYYLTENITGREFIDQNLLFPTGAFTLPRKGKISVGYSAPPLAVASIAKLDDTNTARPEQNKISRSINKNFYNNLLFKYNNNVIDNDKFLSGDLTQSADSKTRIPVGNRVFTIEAPGLRPSSDTDLIIGILRNRILDRYKFGAERIVINAFYGKAFSVDVGDIVLYGNSTLQLVDTRAASRDFDARLFEVVNKSMDIKSGNIKLELVDTQYSAQGARFGVFSPASIVGTGSTTTTVIITDSFGTASPEIEKTKWVDFIGEQILVRSVDMTFAEEVTLTGFVSGNNYAMTVSPALSTPPSAGYYVEVANYPDTTETTDSAIYKNMFCFSDPQVQIASGSSQTVFTVGAGDASKFFVGAYVIIHKYDWSAYSEETQVSDVTGTTITVEDALGFTPDNTYYVDLIGFKDDGYPYRYL